jgi:hypothetical protein
MDPTTSPPAFAPATRILYHHATPEQVALALADAVQALRQHFPTLGFASWSAGLQQLQPTLLVDTAQRVYLDEVDLARLGQVLAADPELPQLSPSLFCNQAFYLAQRLVNYQREAIRALGEIEASPAAYGGGVCTLLFSLATGNGVAYEVCQRLPYPPNLPDSGTTPARIDAIRCARGEPSALLTTSI